MPYQAYRPSTNVGLISEASSGNSPDGGINALSGLQTINECRPDKRSAIRQFAGWRHKCLIRPTVPLATQGVLSC
ncbi:hypothetical protein F9G36_08950 [Salmonella enterica subsp. enterica]|uniref:Uncharacterized protein n=1 Tax=Salmonella enterica I TaxID=59201 RepID=A0A625QYE9_SALET|nr:hypothetical protein [Salmonella enterica subsp. enterica serovar Ajiobo]